MFSTTSAIAADLSEITTPSGRMLVCAAEPGRDEVHVAIADGVYEVDGERIFWREAPEREVLRLPIELPVTTRLLKSFPPRRPGLATGGEQAPPTAVHLGQSLEIPVPVTGPAPGLDQALAQALAQALVSGDADLAYAHAVLLWRESGLSATYDAMRECLAALADRWAAGSGAVLTEHRATRAAIQASNRLAALSPTPAQCGTVVLAVPPGDQHTAALGPLAHLIQEAGHPTQVVDELPIGELLGLAQAPGTLAIVMSVHTPKPDSAVRALLKALRQAAPSVLLAVGGPGIQQPSSAMLGADLVGSDVGELLARLDSCSSALTDRERQVLAAVADGLTNGEIAALLGVAQATVKSHLDNIYAKTQTEHRAAAVARALRRGWIT
jgi:DNA-binding CsgD family transcriptional regulator/methanogenic corrinoid protein MtbC1